MTKASSILHIAVPTPLRRRFDYLPPEGCDLASLKPGIRLKIPFGRQKVVGVLLATGQTSEISPKRLRRVLEILDTEPVLPPDVLGLLQWASSYYHHPIGEVMMGALPTLLRKGGPPVSRGPQVWQLTELGEGIDPQDIKRAPRQTILLTHLQVAKKSLRKQDLDGQHGEWRSIMARMVAKGWVQVSETSCLGETENRPTTTAPTLNAEQQHAIHSVSQSLNSFQSFLLDGVTGSGKTEVYLGLIEKVLAAGKQAMVLVPEIGLTPQLVRRFRARLACPVAVLHSGLSHEERLCAWLAARDGRAPVVIGTRSAVFTPLQKPGLFIVDEEHDLSFKQQDGFRYGARDLAIMRARKAEVPVVLGSATPSLESLYNSEQQRFQTLHLSQRAGNAKAPTLHIINVRNQPMEDCLSRPLLDAVGRHLQAQGQVLLFLNRRGYAPILMCHGCGWIAPCERCDTRMTLHQRDERLRCHHCGAERLVTTQCPACGNPELHNLGYGTERMEQILTRHFPEHTVIRIDRDSTRRKGALQSLLNAIHDGHGQILIGTQMLAKGHHFPNVTLVGILDADYGLFSADFRAAERMGQLILQVAGRAGRAERPGEVLIQTHHPDHPLLTTLVKQDYATFAKTLLQERSLSCLPPYSHLALLRAEAVAADAAMAFLDEARQRAKNYSLKDLQFFGPLPAPMERRAGRYRAQLLLQSSQRSELQRLLGAWAPQLEDLKSGRRVRWSLDVDPLDMY